MLRVTTQFHISSIHGARGFYNLDKMFDTLTEFQESLDDEIEMFAAMDAADIAAHLAEEYEHYLSYAQEEKILDDDVDKQFKSSRIILDHKNGRYYGAPRLEVIKKADGYHVMMSGKDIIYQEYGTGTPGEKHGYPGELPAGWSYGSGPNVLQNGGYKNGGELNDEVPPWYTKMLNAGTIKPSDMIWMSPRGKTMGDYPGAFMYNTHEWVMDELDSPTSKNLRLGRKYLYEHISDKLKKGLK